MQAIRHQSDLDFLRDAALAHVDSGETDVTEEMVMSWDEHDLREWLEAWGEFDE